MGRPKKPDALSAAERSRAWRAENADPKISVTAEAKDLAKTLAQARGVTVRDLVSALILAASG